MKFSHWIHHLFNPHCKECAEEKQEDKVCQSCETLKMQLAIANHEKKKLLDGLLDITKPSVPERSPAPDYEQIKPKTVTWSVRRAMLEAEDRKTAQILAEQKKAKPISEQIADLEKEVGMEEGAKPDA